MNIRFLLLCFILPPTLACAQTAHHPCVHDARSEIFEEYHSLSDEKIAKRCTYDIEKHEPDVDESRLKANARRTSICEKGLAKMREISERYVAKKKEVCLNARSAATCTDTTSQKGCMVDAANLAANVKKGQEELSSIMLEGKEKLAAVSRFNRLLSSKFKSQQKKLGLMTFKEKNKIFTNGDRVNDPPAHTKHAKVNSRPNQSKPDRPTAKNSPSSGISAAGQRQETNPSTSVSNSRPPAYEPRAEMRPQDYGARSWAEYEKKLPLFIQQNERAERQLERFEEARGEKHTEHRAAASEMAAKAAQFFVAAEKLGYAGEDLAEWKKENPVLSKSPGALPPKPEAASAEERGDEPGAPVNSFGSVREQAKEKAPALENASLRMPAEEMIPPSPEEQALADFDPKLRDHSQTPAMVAERSRLREILRRRMQAVKNGDPPESWEKVPGAIVGDILAETKVAAGRGPDSGLATTQEVGSVDVESALQDIEAQLRELDRQSGILESASPSLFARVKALLKKYAKSM